MRQYYVYILTSKRNGTLYVGVTNNLYKRVYAHKSDLVGGFTREYRVHNLVYYEVYRDIRDALDREKRMKKWKRQWEIQLIEKTNPQWRDLYSDVVD
jgi:putative endonuclease